MIVVVCVFGVYIMFGGFESIVCVNIIDFMYFDCEGLRCGGDVCVCGDGEGYCMYEVRYAARARRTRV